MQDIIDWNCTSSGLLRRNRSRSTHQSTTTAFRDGSHDFGGGRVSVQRHLNGFSSHAYMRNPNIYYNASVGLREGKFGCNGHDRFVWMISSKE